MATVTRIRHAAPSDAPAIADIYAYYVRHTLVTFEIDPPSAPEIALRMAQSIMWLVCETVEDHELVGFAYARPYKPERPAYDVSIEISVYLRHDSGCIRRGIGQKLVNALFATVRTISKEGMPETQRYRQALAIQATPLGDGAPEDRTAGAFYRALGFRHAGTLCKVGYKLGTWADVDF